MLFLMEEACIMLLTIILAAMPQVSQLAVTLPEADISDMPTPRGGGTTPATPRMLAVEEHSLMTTFLRRFPRAATMGLALPTGADQETPLQKYRLYYYCVRVKERRRAEVPRTAILSQEGQEVELSCDLCLRPDQDVNTYSIDWRRFQQRVGAEGEVPQDPKRFILTDTKSLIIKNIDIMDAGQYACLRNGQPQAFYQVDVLFNEQRRLIYEDDASSTPEPELHLETQNLMVFTTWSDWSQCNRCGSEGLRRRIGLCTVKKIIQVAPIKPEDVPNMKHYPKGVPCRSTLLPRSVAKIPHILDRQSETLMGSCLVPCPTVAEVRQVTDSSGTVIKEVQVQYFSQNEVPQIPTVPKRDVMYKDAGRRLILKCPIGSEGKKKEEMIRWQNGTVVINPLTIRRASRGRVRIDHMNRLLIRRLKVTDTAAFNCWLGGTHVATIKVIVTKPMNKNIKAYISYAGFGVTVLAVVLIAFSLCCKKPTKTAK